MMNVRIVSFHKDRIITIAIMAGSFGGLVGGPIASLANYYSSPQDRFRLFIIPEFIGFACLGLMTTTSHIFC
jgi:hypothetical protein